MTKSFLKDKTQMASKHKKVAPMSVLIKNLNCSPVTWRLRDNRDWSRFVRERLWRSGETQLIDHVDHVCNTSRAIR